MSLLDKLGLAPAPGLPATIADADGASPPSRTDADAARPASPPARVGDASSDGGPKGQVIEPSDEDFELAKQIPIGQLVWAKRTRRIWGFADKDGALCQGGSVWTDKDLAKMNALAAHAVEMVVQLQELEEAWRTDVARVRQGTKLAAGGLVKVQKAMSAMADRMKTDKDFFRDVNDYLKAEGHAKSFVQKLDTAQRQFKAAAHGLQAAADRKALNEAEGEQADAAAALEKKKAEQKEAQEIYKDVFALATKLVKQDWKGAAEKAIEWVGKKAVDAAFADDLEQLKATLAAAKGKVEQLKNRVFAEELAKAQEELAAAAGHVASVREEFENALDDLSNQQANAQNELKESRHTAPVGEMIGARVEQIAAISAAKASCAAYARVADSGKSKLQKIANEFAKVGTWLDQAARSDAAFARDTGYAKVIERSSRLNADVFWDFAATIPAAKRECGEAVTWMADKSDKGPMGDFEKIRKATSQGLKTAA